MNNTTVSQALHDLELGLKDIESARNQVIAVTEQGQNIIEAFKNILQRLDSIEKGFDVNGKDFSNAIDETAKALTKKAQEAMENMVVVQASNEQLLESGLSKSMSILQEFDQRIIKLNEEANKLEQRLSELDLKRTLDQMRYEISEQSTALLKHTKDALKRVQEEQKSDFNVAQEKFEQNLQRLQQSHSRRFSQLLVVSVVGFLGVAALFYFYNFPE